ncbi:apolipoprotein C1 [Homo sapiens]|uniref:Apolipoprotein C1 n=1 Tax=Homo sapiens TaxID=9606 RepID=K7EPF9_HUMAN|nr:apolipoprotein C-I isoform b precursor [Homo sapiens]KAI2591641.1 apolipoprotein C1 [Homo sapiens]KAI4043301.1 apolipoprotein C1 [Homo sapiens]
MRLFLSLPVLVVVLSIVLEGPAPAQGTPDVSSALDKLKEFGNTLEDKARELISRIKQSELSAKMRLEPFPGHGRAGVCFWVEPWQMVQDEQIEKKTSPGEADNIPLVTQLDLKGVVFRDISESEGETQD